MNIIYKNLIIRNAEAADAEQLCAWWNDGEIMAHAGFPNGLGETPENIRKSLMCDTDETNRHHIIELDTEAVGEMNYRNIGNGTAEIGIKICDRTKQEKGCGTELLTVFIDALFTYYGYNKIILDTNVKNERAQHVYEHKLGFRRLGVRENSWRDQLGMLQSAVDFELTKESWASARRETLNYIHLRLERPFDHRAVEELTREAFWGCMDHPTCDGEHLLVHKLRSLPSFIPELDYVAEINGQLAGHVIYSNAKIVTPNGEEIGVLNFGPLSILPLYKRRGVGAALVRYTIAKAIKLGHRAIVFYGHPDYYPRFGFQRASVYGITSESGESFDALMAMPLYDGALNGVSGKYIEDPAFKIDAIEAAQFDHTFKPKNPIPLISVDTLTDKLSAHVLKTLIAHNITLLSQTQNKSGVEMLKWDGIREQDIILLNSLLKKYDYAEKLLPSSYILQLADMGIRIPLVEKVREKDGAAVYSVASEGRRYILLVFETAEDCKHYLSHNISSETIVKCTANALLIQSNLISNDA